VSQKLQLAKVGTFFETRRILFTDKERSV